MEREGRLNPYLLCGVTVMFTIPAVIPGIGLFSIFSLAPLFALIDIPIGEKPLRRAALIWIALALSFWSARFGRSDTYEYALIAAPIYALCITCAFVAYLWARRTLGGRTGKILIIIFWIALEYVVLKSGIGHTLIFVADLSPEWTSIRNWTIVTGYLGLSLWVLAANWTLAEGLLTGRFRAGFVAVFAVLVLAPLLLSNILPPDGKAIDRPVMLMYYAGADIHIAFPDYATRGEWIPRTAAWVSVLVLLYVAVKSKTRKK